MQYLHGAIIVALCTLGAVPPRDAFLNRGYRRRRRRGLTLVFLCVALFAADYRRIFTPPPSFSDGVPVSPCEAEGTPVIVQVVLEVE